MQPPAWENLNEFFQLDDFAVTGTVTRKAGGTFTVVGHFDDPYLNATLGDFERDTVKPKFVCKFADVRTVVRGDKIAIDGVTYEILSAANPDGTGVAALELARP